MAPKSKCKKAKAQPAVAAPKPQGGKTKRTPTSTFDGAAGSGKDTVLEDVSRPLSRRDCYLAVNWSRAHKPLSVTGR